MRFRLAIALLVALLITLALYARLPGHRETGILDTDPPTPYAHYTPTGTSRGRVLVVHGLDSASNVMNILSYGLSDAGFEVYAIDLPGHGESRAPANAIRARNVVAQVFEKLGPQTMVLGHSFGGGTLLDIANDRPITRMVLFSPAPIPLQAVQAEHVLVFEGQFDPAGIRVFAPQIQDSVTGTFELRNLAWTGHTGGLFRPAAISEVAEWLGGDARAIHTEQRLLLIALSLVLSVALGVALIGMWPSPSGRRWPDSQRADGPDEGSSGLKIPHPERQPAGCRGTLSRGERAHPTTDVLYYTLAGLLSAGILAVVDVVSWLRIFATDYLIGFLFLTGILLLARCKWVPPQGRGLAIALGAAAYLILVPGLLSASELLHAVVSGSRWWRFPAIFALGLPLFYVDEHVLRTMRPARKAAGAAILTRVMLVAISVSGALILNRRSAFILLLAPIAALFWIGLWFAAGVVRTRTDAFSAACFSALLQAWFFAALFVMT